LGASAGIFHGYAYGEAIIGAEMSPLAAYLVSFTLIQGGIALAAYWLGQQLSLSLPSLMRYCGLAICAIGFVFFSQAI
jgi:urease accessory protein